MARQGGGGWDLSVHLSALSAQLCKHTQWALVGKERLANKTETWRECTDPQHYFLSLVPHNSVLQSLESQVTPKLLPKKKKLSTPLPPSFVSLSPSSHSFSSHTPFPYSAVIPPSFHFSLDPHIPLSSLSLTGLQQTSLPLEERVSHCLKAITPLSCVVCS